MFLELISNPPFYRYISSANINIKCIIFIIICLDWKYILFIIINSRGEDPPVRYEYAIAIFLFKQMLYVMNNTLLSIEY